MRIGIPIARPRRTTRPGRVRFQLIDGRHRLELEVPRIMLDSVTLCSIGVGLREFYRRRMLIDQPLRISWDPKHHWRRGRHLASAGGAVRWARVLRVLDGILHNDGRALDWGGKQTVGMAACRFPGD